MEGYYATLKFLSIVFLREEPVEVKGTIYNFTIRNLAGRSKAFLARHACESGRPEFFKKTGLLLSQERRIETENLLFQGDRKLLHH